MPYLALRFPPNSACSARLGDAKKIFIYFRDFPLAVRQPFNIMKVEVLVVAAPTEMSHTQRWQPRAESLLSVCDVVAIITRFE